MDYYDLVISGKKGKKVSFTVSGGDYAYNTTLRTSATLIVLDGGRVESTYALNGTTVSNAGLAEDTFLSGGTMRLFSGGSADRVTVARNGKLTVALGAAARNVIVQSTSNSQTTGNVDATVVGGDTSTLILGSNPRGDFYLSNGVASNFLVNSLGMLNISSGGTALDTVINFGGSLTVNSGGSATGVQQGPGGNLRGDVYGGGATLISGSNELGNFGLSGGVASNFFLYDGGVQQVFSGGSVCHTVVNGQMARLEIWSGGVASAVSACRGSITIYESGAAVDTWVGSSGIACSYDGARISGMVVSGALIVDSGNTGEGESGGQAVLSDIHVASGGILRFCKAAQIGDAVEVDGTLQIVKGVSVSGVTVRSTGSALVSGSFIVTTSAWNAKVANGGKVEVSGDAVVFGAAVNSGGSLTVRSAGSAADTTLTDGGFMVLNSGAVIDKVTLNFDGAAAGTARVNDLALLPDTAELHLRGAVAGGNYTIAQTGATGVAVHCDSAGLYDNPVAAGESYTNAFTSMTYSMNAEGTAVAAADGFVLTPKAAAGALTDADTALNTGDRAAKWDGATAVASGAVIALAPASIGGNVWLDIAGTDLRGTTLYGTDDDFSGTVNLRAAAGATLGSVAAGATAGGSIGGVRLTVDGAAFTGGTYAGGFGSVTGTTETFIADGMFAKDFYAGALANYAKTDVWSDLVDVNLTVAGGTFSGNIYGASAVKMGAKSGEVAHTVGNVGVTLAGGEAESENFCLFAGGYATGSNFSETAAYTVESVTVDISGGDWGKAHGGRGIFGGIFASGVLARIWAEEEEDIDVTINVSDGSIGNVYGGGWAQKGGASEVMGKVNITVTGGTVGNIFGSGSHSTTGGTTSVGDVNITISGGTVTGNVYARGQFDGDLVTGDTLVIFSGASDFTCGVYGYDYGSAEPGSAELYFAGFTGSFAGAIGGFDSIGFGGGTAMTLGTTAANVSNGAWTFDVSERDAELSDTAVLEWSLADFAGDTVTLNLTDGQNSAWSLVSAATTTVYDKFDVQIDGTSILSDLIDIDDVIAGTGTAYDGWGFTVEDTVLKFKQLA